MVDTPDHGTPEIPDAPVRPKGRPGRKPKGSVPVIIPETPDKPDPDHVLTWRQRKVLQVIRDSVQKRGYPPSMREIGEEGDAEITADGMDIASQEAAYVPLVGRIAAGGPILAEQQVEEIFPLP